MSHTPSHDENECFIITRNYDCRGKLTMVTGVKMERQSLIYNKVVYVAIPKRLFDDAICERAFTYLRALKPLALIDPREMFDSNEEWLAQFPKYLKPCEVCVVVTDNGFIGKGTYKEIGYFSKCNLPYYLYVEHNKCQGIFPVINIEVMNLNDWTDYAWIE